MNYNLNEFPILLCCIWAGTLLGIVYDALRLVRISGKKLAVIVSDLLFSVCFFAVVFGVVLFADKGRVRVHYLAAVFVSLLVWLNFPGKLIRAAFCGLRGKHSGKNGMSRGKR